MDTARHILNCPLALTAFKNSFYLSVGRATPVMPTLVVAWITVKTKLRGSESLARISAL